MNYNDDNESTPNPSLLPFGGFEVASLLSMIANGERTFIDKRDESSGFPHVKVNVSSGWLRSKIMAG